MSASSKKETETLTQPENASSASEPSEKSEDQAQADSEKIVALEKEKSDLYDRLLRKHAELENYRKRVEREKGEWYNEGVSDLVKAVLPVIDGFDRALASFKEANSSEATVETYRSGVELLRKELQNVLKKFGVSSIEALGGPFDPHFHEAVARVESDEHQENEVVEEVQKGYLYKDRLLRPTQVKVAVKPISGQSS